MKLFAQSRLLILSLMVLANLAAASARADILFIDANNSPTEVATARRAAAARGEKLFVVPDHASGVKLLNATYLNQQIASAIKGGRTFDSIVISGETIGNGFFGKNGDVTSDDIVDAVNKNPSLKKSLHSLYGLGCYSGTYSLALKWKAQIPSLKMIMGYDGQAPKSTRQAGLDYLYGALLKEKRIVEANDEHESTEDIQRIIQAIPDFNRVNSAVYTQFACVSSTYGNLSDADFMNRCTAPNFDILADKFPDFLSMVGPEISSGNVPCDRDNSWLRNLYDQMRNYQHCGEVPGPFEQNFKYISDHSDELIRLIYFPNVLANFEKAHKNEFAELNAIAAEHQPGFPQLNLQTSFACDSKSGLSRPQILDWIQKISESENSLAPNEKQLVSSLQSRMQTQLTELNCVPESWIEPPVDSAPKDASSSCFTSRAGP